MLADKTWSRCGDGSFQPTREAGHSDKADDLQGPIRAVSPGYQLYHVNVQSQGDFRSGSSPTKCDPPPTGHLPALQKALNTSGTWSDSLPRS